MPSVSTSAFQAGAVDQALRMPGLAAGPLEVVAGLAELGADALHLADLEALADQGVQVDAPGEPVGPDSSWLNSMPVPSLRPSRPSLAMSVMSVAAAVVVEAVLRHGMRLLRACAPPRRPGRG